MEERVVAIGSVSALLAALVTAWGTLRGKSRSTPAETQEQINGGFKAFMESATHEILDLKKDAADREARIVTLEGEIRELTQYNQSLAAALRRHGIPVPSRPFTMKGKTAIVNLDKPN